LSATLSPQSLGAFTRDLIGDLKKLRAGKITNADARVRAQLAREILRAAHLHLEGLKILSSNAKLIGEAK
jgi:hypothetical protein